MKIGDTYLYYDENNIEKHVVWIENTFDIARYFDQNVFHPATKRPLFKIKNYNRLWEKLDVRIKEQLTYLWNSSNYPYSHYSKEKRRQSMKDLTELRNTLTCLKNQFAGEVKENSSISKIMYQNYIDVLTYCIGMCKTIEKLQWQKTEENPPKGEDLVEVFCTKKNSIIFKLSNEVRFNPLISPYWRPITTLPIDKEKVLPTPFCEDDCFPTD